MEQKSLKARISYRCYRIIRWLVWAFYPKITLKGAEQLPGEPCLIVGNHCKMNGPIIAELYIPGNRAIWCAGEMMHRKEVAAYADRMQNGIDVNINTVAEMVDMAKFLGMDAEKYLGKVDVAGLESSYK